MQAPLTDAVSMADKSLADLQAAEGSFVGTVEDKEVNQAGVEIQVPSSGALAHCFRFWHSFAIAIL